MKRCFVWFLAALTALSFAAGDGRDMPVDYRAFWEGNDGSGLACFSSLPLLQLERAYGMDGLAGTFAGKEAPNEFDSALGHAKQAGEELEFAKGNSTVQDWNSYFMRVELYREEGSALFLSRCIGSVPLDTVSWMSFCLGAERAACEGLRHAQRALTLSSKAANEAREAALARLDELGSMGAGCSNYSGSEKGAYERVNSLSQLSNEHGLGAPVEWGYENQSQRYAAALAEAYDVHWAFEGGSAGFDDPDAFAKATVLMCGGSENLITGWINVHEQLGVAIEGMNGKYNSSKIGYSFETDVAEANYNALKQDGYLLIDGPLVSRLADAAPNEILGVHDAAPPSEKLFAAYASITEASVLSLNAEAAKDGKQECYLANAIGLLNGAQMLLREANSSMREIEDSVQAMEAGSRSLCEDRLAEVGQGISSYGANSTAAARLKAQAQAELEREQAILESARGKRTGARLESYAAVLELSASTLLLLSDENLSIEQRRDDANLSLQHLCELAKKAEKDGLDVAAETEFCGTAQARLGAGLAEDFFSISGQAQRLEDGLYLKAKVRFGYLDATISGLRQMASAIRAYSAMLPSASSFGPKLSELDLLVREYGVELDPKKALGNYAKLEAKVLSLEADFESAQASLVKEALEKTAKVEVNEYETVLGEETQVGVRISLSNPLPFGSNSSVAVSVALPLEVRSCRLSSSSMLASAANGVAEITLPSVSAGNSYSVSLSGGCGVAAYACGSAQTKILSLSTEALDAETHLSLVAKRNLTRLRVPVKIIGAPAEILAEAEGAFPESAAASGSGKAEVVLSGVQNGTVLLILRYSLPTPYSIQVGDYAVENVSNRTSRVSFTASVTSNGLELKDVPVQVPAYNQSIRAGDISITPLGEARIGEFSAAAMPGGTLISWKVKRLGAGDVEEFQLSYEFDDSEGYARTLLSQATERIAALSATGVLEDEHVDSLRSMLSQADAFIEAGKFNNAIAALQELNSAADAALREGVARATASSSFSEQKTGFEQKLEEARAIFSGLSFNGFGHQELDSEISKAEAALLRAESLSGNGKFSEAGVLLAEEDSKLDGAMRTALSAAISSIPDELAGELLSFARDALAQGDYELALSRLAEAKAAAEAAEAEKLGQLSTLVATVDAEAAAFVSLKAELSASLNAFSKATTLTVGRASTSSESKQLANATLERDVKNAEKEADSLSKLFSDFGSGNKTEFASAHSSELGRLGERLSALNSTILAADSATAKYKEAAEASCDEARLRLVQASSLAPPSEQYGQLIANFTSVADDANSALTEKRFVDALILAEKANAGLSLMLVGISNVEQEGNASAGLPLYLFALPLVAFALLGYLYFRKKPEKKEPKVVRRLG